MPFWIAAIIALALAGLATPSLQRLHGMALPDPATLALLSAAFALAALVLRSRGRRRVTD